MGFASLYPSYVKTGLRFKYNRFRDNMPNHFKKILLIIMLGMNVRVSAEIVLDGTLGPAKVLSGPYFAVEADLGQQVGNNLFHSFQNFNLSLGESATFSGPDTVNHIISRVTGGEISLIDVPS